MAELLNSAQVCALVDISIYTLDKWYKFRELYPDNEYAKLLPPVTKQGRSRYWERNDVYKLIEFKAAIPHGRNGILGDVTQVWVREQKEVKKHAKKKCKRNGVARSVG